MAYNSRLRYNGMDEIPADSLPPVMAADISSRSFFLKSLWDCIFQ